MGLFSKRPGSTLGNTGLVTSTPANGGRNNGMLDRRRGGNPSSGDGLGAMTVWMWVLWVIAFVGWWVAFIGMCVGEAKLSEYARLTHCGKIGLTPIRLCDGWSRYGHALVCHLIPSCSNRIPLVSTVTRSRYPYSPISQSRHRKIHSSSAPPPTVLHPCDPCRLCRQWRRVHLSGTGEGTCGIGFCGKPQGRWSRMADAGHH
jgi:hypothetical protein